MPSYMNPQYKNATDIAPESAYGVARKVDFGSNQQAQDEIAYKNDYGVEQPVAYKNDAAYGVEQPVAYKNGEGSNYNNGAEGSLGQDPIVGDLASWMAPEEEPVAPGMSRMPANYKGEDQRWREKSRLDDTKQSKVHYLDAQEQQDANLKVEDGRMMDKDGNGLTTQGNHAVLRDSMDDAHLWAMDGNDQVRQGSSAARDVDATHHEVMHHSSLFAGADVKCAGEMKVEDGFVKELNNHSGHYSPKDEQLLAATQQMSDSGLNLDMTQIQPVVGGGSYFGAQYLATQGDTAKMDQKDAVNDQIRGFDKSTLRKAA